MKRVSITKDKSELGMVKANNSNYREEHFGMSF